MSTAGIGAAYALRSEVADALWMLAALAFIVAIALVLRSWFLVKHRAIRRRDAHRKGEAPPVFKKTLHSWWWDTRSA